MKTSATSILTLSLGALVSTAAWIPTLHAAEAVSGKAGVLTEGVHNWVWTPTNRNATVQRENLLSVKVSSGSLSGAISIPGADGKPASHPISNPQFENGALRFAFIREVNGNSITNEYSAKIEGDSLVGTIAFNRNGTAATRPWQAKDAGARTEAAAVTPPKPGYDENGNKIVNETHYKELNIADTEKLLAEHPETVILDLRPPAQYAAGHIPGAKNADLSDKETYLENLKPLDKNKRYLVYSVVGHFRTVRALEYFEANGFPHAAAIDGGFKAWSTANKPVEK